MHTNQKGFTLVEMLAVMVVFTVVAALSAGILITSLRTAGKSTVISSVNQNGTYALNQITKTIRNARILDYPYPCGDPQDPTATSAVWLRDTNNARVILACSGSPLSTIAQYDSSLSGPSLLDTTSDQGVRLMSCSFSCSQNAPTDYPTITIRFALLQRAQTTFVDQTASDSAVPFSTSVIMRNLFR
jgi:prepilin-type N-terminal cleavage/methylation domain-containing protein